MDHAKNKFYVIAVISNPERFKSRIELYKKFEKEVLACGANLVTVEAAFGDRLHSITDRSNPNHILLKTDHEIWHKENMINVGLSHLPHDWEYVAWIDADISFVRSDWITEALHQLQHHMIIQMWQNAIDLGPTGQVIQNHTSFGYCVSTGQRVTPKFSPYYTFPHPGFAWAARREAIEATGGLLDIAIMGSGDHHMAYALLGRVDETVPGKVHPNYVRHLKRWEANAVKNLKYDIGFMPGTILHHWHGKKKDRRYTDRWKIIIDNQYDPDSDLIRDSRGLYQLTDNKPKLRDDCRLYFKNRFEDSIDLE